MMLKNFMSVFQSAWIKGMDMSNVIGCFSTAGVYPTDRRVVLSQLGLETADVLHSLKYLSSICAPRIVQKKL